MGFFRKLTDYNREIGGDVLNLSGSKKSDKLAQHLGLSPPDIEERSNVGLGFSSGLNRIDEYGVTVDPSITAKKEAGLNMVGGSLSSLRESRESLGTQDEFIEQRLQPLQKGLRSDRENLQERQAKTGVTGEFGKQALETFDAEAQDTLAQAEAGAFNDFEKLSQSFDKSEGGLLQMQEAMKSNDFAQQARARGMSADLLSQLVDINLTEQGIRTEKATARGQKTGTAISLIGKFFSSRTYKHSMEKIDNQKILDSMMELDVEKWQYNGEDIEHIGCYSEDFNKRFGIEGAKEINVVDIVGVLMASIQAQQEQINELKGNQDA